MAFKIIAKFKPEQIKSRNLDTSFLKNYYKGVQKILVKKTSVEQTTPYFFCADYAEHTHLFILGKTTPDHKQLFRAAAKGEEGFEKTNVSLGSCFILDEDGIKTLCLYPNTTLSKGKKKPILKILNKIQRTHMDQIHKVRWLEAPLIVDAEDSSKVESAASNDSSSKQQTAQISKDDVVEKAKNLKRGIEKLVKDVMPRYKKRETTDNDAAFVKALRKAGHLFLAQLPQTDESTRNSFSSQKKILESGLPQWKELEARIHSQKGKVENTAALKKSLLKVIEKMNESRSEIKTILQRVNLKALG